MARLGQHARDESRDGLRHSPQLICATHNRNPGPPPGEKNPDMAVYFEINRRLWCVGKVNASYGHFHHNNGRARPFSLYAGSSLCAHIFAEYGAGTGNEK